MNVWYRIVVLIGPGMHPACREVVSERFQQQLGMNLQNAGDAYLKEYPGTQLAYEFDWPESLQEHDQKEIVEAICTANGKPCKVTFLEHYIEEASPEITVFDVPKPRATKPAKAKKPVKLTKSAEQLEGICWCACEPGKYEAVSGQADCPWCGCGWLWSCSHCRKAFTIAQDRRGNKYTFLDGLREPLHLQAEQLHEEGRKRLKTRKFWSDLGPRLKLH